MLLLSPCSISLVVSCALGLLPPSTRLPGGRLGRREHSPERKDVRLTVWLGKGPALSKE